MKDVYLLVKALVPDDVQPADVRDAALESLNVPPTAATLDWTWDVAVSERHEPLGWKPDRADWRMIWTGVIVTVIAVALIALVLFVIPVPN